MPKYIEKSRHGLYYLRLPSRLAHLNDGKRISLKTHSKRLAITRASSHISAIEQTMRNAMSLKPRDHEEFAFEEEVRALAIDMDERNAKLDSILRAHPGDQAHAAIGLVSQERLRNVMVQQASDLISEQIRGGYLAPGLTLSAQNQVFHNLCQYAENVSIEIQGARGVDGAISAVSLAKAQKSYRELLYSSYLELCDVARASTAATEPSIERTLEAQSTEKQAAKTSHTLLTIYELWIAEHKSLGGNPTFSTEQEYQRHANVLAVLSNHSPIESFTVDVFSRLHKKTLQIKAYSATGKEKDMLTIDILIPKNGDYKKIAAETALGYSQRLYTLHLFAFHKGWTSINPESINKPMFDRIAEDGKRQLSHDETPRKSYSIAELQAIFDGWIYRPAKIHNNASVFPYQFWIPLIAIYTGMRIAEISGLTTKNIEQRDGIWCIKIEENADLGTRVKTFSSKRIVPIHSKLRELGFLDYVHSRKKCKSLMLFDGVYYHEKNGWGHSPSTFFTRIPSEKSQGAGYFYSTGIHKTAHDGRDVHAFRHTLIDELRNNGLSHTITPYIIESISGHQKPKKTEADHYGDGLGLKQTAEFLEYANYQGLDLKHVSYETFIKTYKVRLERSLRKFKERQLK